MNNEQVAVFLFNGIFIRVQQAPREFSKERKIRASFLHLDLNLETIKTLYDIHTRYKNH